MNKGWKFWVGTFLIIIAVVSSFSSGDPHADFYEKIGESLTIIILIIVGLYLVIRAKRE